MNFSQITDNLPYLLDGLRYTLSLTIVTMVAGIVLGTILAIWRLSNIKTLRVISGIYVWCFRAVPLVLVIFWFYILVPIVTGIRVGADGSAYITFIIFEAAYFCEIIRSGIQSISHGQTYAGMAVGFTRYQTMRYVILPQAFRNILPILMMETIILFQDTSLVYVVGANDLLGVAGKIANRDNAAVTMYLSVAVVYFAISFTLSYIVRRLQKKISIKGYLSS